MKSLYTLEQIQHITSLYRTLFGSEENWNKLYNALDLNSDGTNYHNLLLTNSFNINLDSNLLQIHNQKFPIKIDTDSKDESCIRELLNQIHNFSSMNLSLGLNPWSDWCLSCWNKDSDKKTKILILGGDWYSILGAAEIPAATTKQTFLDERKSEYADFVFKLFDIKRHSDISLSLSQIETLIRDNNILFHNAFPFLRKGTLKEGHLPKKLIKTCTSGLRILLEEIIQPEVLICWGSNSYNILSSAFSNQDLLPTIRKALYEEQWLNTSKNTPIKLLTMYHPASRGLFYKNFDFIKSKIIQLNNSKDSRNLVDSSVM